MRYRSPRLRSTTQRGRVAPSPPALISFSSLCGHCPYLGDWQTPSTNRSVGHGWHVPLRHSVPAPAHSQCPWHAVPIAAAHLVFRYGLLHRPETSRVQVSFSLPQHVPEGPVVASIVQMRPAWPHPLATGRAATGATRSRAITPSAPPTRRRNRLRREPPRARSIVNASK